MEGEERKEKKEGERKKGRKEETKKGHKRINII